MNHIVITLVKWGFLLLGLAFLAGAALGPPEARWPLGLFGGVFAAIGGSIIGYGRWRAQQEADLRQNGHLVHADFKRVELNETLEVNGDNPFRIVAQWHDVRQNRVFVFKSANLWFDPSEFVEGRKIPVFVDLDKPSRYHVDTSFLPTVHH